MQLKNLQKIILFEVIHLHFNVSGLLERKTATEKVICGTLKGKYF